MCIFLTPSMPTPQAPEMPAQAKQPDAGAVRDAVSRRTQDRLRAGANTILSGGNDYGTAPTSSKTLLGQ
jgi:hypothetical protein